MMLLDHPCSELNYTERLALPLSHMRNPPSCPVPQVTSGLVVLITSAVLLHNANTRVIFGASSLSASCWPHLPRDAAGDPLSGSSSSQDQCHCQCMESHHGHSAAGHQDGQHHPGTHYSVFRSAASRAPHMASHATLAKLGFTAFAGANGILIGGYLLALGALPTPWHARLTCCQPAMHAALLQMPLAGVWSVVYLAAGVMLGGACGVDCIYRARCRHAGDRHCICLLGWGASATFVWLSQVLHADLLGRSVAPAPAAGSDVDEVGRPSGAGAGVPTTLSSKGGEAMPEDTSVEVAVMEEQRMPAALSVSLDEEQPAGVPPLERGCCCRTCVPVVRATCESDECIRGA
jgi:hypothetical protein